MFRKLSVVSFTDFHFFSPVASACSDVNPASVSFLSRSKWPSATASWNAFRICRPFHVVPARSCCR
jgi:hypothetical protein